MKQGWSGLYTVFSGLLSTIADDLETVTSRPERVVFAPGQAVWEEVDCGGQLSLTVARVYASDSFPNMPSVLNESHSLLGCAPGMLVGTAFIEIVRCMPLPKSGDQYVSIDRLDTAAQLVLADMVTAYESTMCYLTTQKDTYEIIDFSIYQQESVGPQGGVGGSTLEINIALSR